MSDQRDAGSIWEDSMRVGLPKFDEERKELTRLIEHLDLSPLHSICSDFFILKFGIFQAAVKAFFEHEEILFRELQVPDSVKKIHIVDHGRILQMLNAVYLDSMNKKNQTAIDTYQHIRNDIKQHISKFGQDLREYISQQ